MDPRLSHLKGARVMVVGDLILDRYWYGATRRISPEAPVPVVLIESVEERVGGRPTSPQMLRPLKHRCYWLASSERTPPASVSPSFVGR